MKYVKQLGTTCGALLLSASGKELAARRAAQILASFLDRVERVGIGTGSTVALILEELFAQPLVLEKLASKKLYASSVDTLMKLEELGLSASMDVPARGLDLYVDGADEVEIGSSDCPTLKGRGAAMTLEKIMAYNSRYTIIVVDETKVSQRLGEKEKPVPVEVLRPALLPVLAELRSLGVRAEARTACTCRDGPACTDAGGYVVDVWPWGVMDPRTLEAVLERMPGVVSHGLFIGFVDRIIVGRSSGVVEEVECKRTRRSKAIQAN